MKLYIYIYSILQFDLRPRCAPSWEDPSWIRLLISVAHLGLWFWPPFSVVDFCGGRLLAVIWVAESALKPNY
jgi:hypothetical protein